LKIGITGQDGFIGYHLSQTIKYKFEKYKIVPFERRFLENKKLLNSFISSCDVIVHLAGVNRANSNEEVYTSNIQINFALKEALINCSFKGHLIFASSFQEDSDSLYGKAKKESRVLLEQTIGELGGKFTGLIIPNVFGPFCKANYNSFIATFCSKIVIDQNPKIIKDSKVPIIYIENLVSQIVKIIQYDNQDKHSNIPFDIEIRVSEVLRILNQFKVSYLKDNTLPLFANSFEFDLFNTFRSYINLEKNYPSLLNRHSDERGFFSEILRTEIGGQFSYSTTLPGITRGNHFHTRKIERFAVLKGEAKISLRKIGDEKIYDFFLSGNLPSYIDMPIWFTHSITNIGNEPLITSFWINEPYNPEDSDTYFENV
jgi:UDP-2-acetamido-2,6-beta-L-arabino-hexul-4-ose reductase